MPDVDAGEMKVDCKWLSILWWDWYFIQFLVKAREQERLGWWKMKMLLGKALKEHYKQPLDRRSLTLVCSQKTWLDAQPAPGNHVAALAGKGSLNSRWSGASKMTVHYIYYLLIILFTTHALPRGPSGQAAAESLHEAVVLWRLLL